MSAARVGEHRAVECMHVYRSPAFAMRSRAGVGMTPPKVLGAPKPTSSVMMSSTLGAPLGGTTRGAHHAFDWAAFSLMTPPNFGSGGGSCFPEMVVVALGEPSTPLTCTPLPAAASLLGDGRAPTAARAAAAAGKLGRRSSMLLAPKRRCSCLVTVRPWWVAVTV